jgi:hypothetical protein
VARRLAGRIVTGRIAFFLAGVIDLLAFAAGRRAARRARR